MYGGLVLKIQSCFYKHKTFSKSFFLWKTLLLTSPICLSDFQEFFIIRKGAFHAIAWSLADVFGILRGCKEVVLKSEAFAVSTSKADANDVAGVQKSAEATVAQLTMSV